MHVIWGDGVTGTRPGSNGRRCCFCVSLCRDGRRGIATICSIDWLWETAKQPLSTRGGQQNYIFLISRSNTSPLSTQNAQPHSPWALHYLWSTPGDGLGGRWAAGCRAVCLPPGNMWPAGQEPNCSGQRGCIHCSWFLSLYFLYDHVFLLLLSFRPYWVWMSLRVGTIVVFSDFNRYKLHIYKPTVSHRRKKMNPFPPVFFIYLVVHFLFIRSTNM